MSKYSGCPGTITKVSEGVYNINIKGYDIDTTTVRKPKC